MEDDDGVVLRRSAGVLGTDVHGEFVLIDIESGRYFGLDAAGSAIWRHLEQPCSPAELRAALTAGFGGDPATIEREADAFVDILAANGLVDRSGGAAA